MKNVSPELYCTLGVATFIAGLFMFVIGLRSNGDVWFLGLHFYMRNFVVFATLVAMIGAAATTYGLILLRKPQGPN